jgi:hypothetical protein
MIQYGVSVGKNVAGIFNSHMWIFKFYTKILDPLIGFDYGSIIRVLRAVIAQSV